MVILQVLAFLLLLGAPTAGAHQLDDHCSASGTVSSSTASLLQRAPPSRTTVTSSQVQRVSRAKTRAIQRTNARLPFPFELVLFPHLPKVGGTSMRGALVELCRARGQKLQVCYNDLRCTDKMANGNLTEHNVSVLRTNHFDYDAVMTWGLNNVSFSDNQIVYGHGVRAGFERTWGLAQNFATHAHIAVLREPLPLLLSAWADQSRDHRFPNYNLTLDQWISRGKAEAFVDYYLSFFVDIEVPDPWDPQRPAAFEPSNGVPILASTPHWKELLTAAVEAPNSLMLLQDNWESSLDRLAKFLHLIPVERDLMLHALGKAENSSPAVEVCLQKDNLARLIKAAEPLQFLYNKIRDMDHNRTIEVSALAHAATVVLAASEPGATVTLSVVLD